MLIGLCWACATGSVAKAHSFEEVSSRIAHIRSNTDRLISSTWKMQDVMGVRKSRTNRSYHRIKSIAYIRWVQHHWAKVERQIATQFRNPPHYGAFMCIHSYEAAWTDGGFPYWGGLQMDYGFQQTYAPNLLRIKGTADHWTPLEQIWTAEKAARTRGFWPWPNTARYCGLL